jgi:hypothetical protein
MRIPGLKESGGKIPSPPLPRFGFHLNTIIEKLVTKGLYNKSIIIIDRLIKYNL